MAGEGGNRPWWPMVQSVNVANGNLHLELGEGSCVTCGGSGASSAYIDPANRKITGPLFIYNTLGTADGILGPKWMVPYDAYLTVDGSGNITVIDADGTQRVYTKNSTDVPQTYTGNIESATLTTDSGLATLTRCNGDQWIFGFDNTADTPNYLKLIKIVSRSGFYIQITRDSLGRISYIQDDYGRYTLFLFVSYGSPSKFRLCEIRELAPGDVGFISTFLDYDSSGRLTSITNGVGETTKFTYDSNDRISNAIDGHGHATVYTYDSSSRVTNIQDPASNNTVFAYTSTTTTVTNRLAKDTVFTIDSSKRCTKIHDPLSNEVEFSWNSTTWELDYELGPKIPFTGTPWSRHKTIYNYGSTAAAQHDLVKQELKKITNTDSTGTLLAKEEWTYNAQHDVLTYKDPLDNVTTYTYKLDGSSNSVGLVLTIVNGEGETTLTNTYNVSGALYTLATSKNGVNKTWTFAYNDHGNTSYGLPNKVTTPEGNITTLDIDIRGRVTKVTDPSGNPVNYIFDGIDRLIKTINADGTTVQKVYDCCHLKAEIDENGHGPTYEYDIMGRLIEVVDSNGEESTMAYNEEGWLTSETDPRGKTKSYSYDDIGRVIEIDYPGGWTETFTYWEPGMLKTKVSTKSDTSTTISYEYDDLYYLTKKDFPTGTDTTYVNKANGLREKMTDASGEKRYYYDKASRLTKVEQGPASFVVGTDQNYVLEYTWNAASQCTEMDLSVRTQSKKSWTYTYHDDGQLDTVVNHDSETTDHDFLTDGRLNKIILATGSTREYFYQDTNDSHAYISNKNKHLRKTLDKKSGGTTICSFAYELDAAGIRLSMTDKDGNYYKYGYDPLYQLKNENKWTEKSPTSRTYQYLWTYDPNGNRLTQHHDGVVSSNTYGDNNEITGTGFSYDNFGNTTNLPGLTLTYDFESHMKSITDGEVTDTHEYDGDSRRMRSKLSNTANWTNFIHDERTESIICEYTLISGTFTLKSLNTHGIGLINTNREGTKRYFHFDGLGATHHLTDGSEVVQDSYAYSAFGIVESSSGSSVNPFRYVGQWGYYDDGARGSNFGLLLLGVRYYSSTYGRFLVWEPLADGDNLYGYVANSPLCWLDSDGLQLQWSVAWNPAGFIFAVGITVLSYYIAKRIVESPPSSLCPPRTPEAAPLARPKSIPKVRPAPLPRGGPRRKKLPKPDSIPWQPNCLDQLHNCSDRPRPKDVPKHDNKCLTCYWTCLDRAGIWPSDKGCDYWNWPSPPFWKTQFP